jgi:hypothetical protein
MYQIENWTPLGASKYALQGDTFFWKLAGVLTKEDIIVYADIIAGLHKRWGYALLFADASAGISMPSETRRQLTESFRDKLPPNHAVVVGASATIRAIASLARGGMKLLLNKEPSIEFLASESTGLARLGEVRESIRKNLGQILLNASPRTK